MCLISLQATTTKSSNVAVASCKLQSNLNKEGLVRPQFLDFPSVSDYKVNVLFILNVDKIGFAQRKGCL